MAADASIYGRIQGWEQPNLLAQAAQGAQLSGVIQQNRLAQLQMQEYERARQEAEKARGVYAGFGSDTNANQQALFQAGLGKEALTYGKSAAEAQKAQLEQQAAQFKLAHEKFIAQRNIIGGVKDQASYTQALKAAEALGFDVSNEPAQYNPEYVASLGDQARTQQERMEAELKQRGFDVTMRGQDITRQNSLDSNATARANNAATVGATIRGQNMTDARQRETNSVAKAPPGYRVTADGNLEPIPGGPAANKADNATEGERKAATLLTRLDGSLQQLNTAVQSNRGAEKPGLLPSLVGKASTIAANSITGPERQRVEAAQLDILDAALTLGTGAAYTKEQLEGYRRSYFPQIGDDQSTVRDKQARLDNVVSAARIAAGRAAKSVPQEQAMKQGISAPGGWSVREVK